MITFPVNLKFDDGCTYAFDEAGPILKTLMKVGVHLDTGNVSKVKES